MISIFGQVRLTVEELCRLGGSMAFSLDNALTLTTIQRHGAGLAEKIQFNVLRSHQEHFFIQGLEKLGLDREVSDAVRCAKFHVLSNFLGGLRVRYAEESPDKAWVVYDTPYWVDSPWTPSMAVAAFRPEMLIETMRAWHANNGVILGNRGLIFVMTQMVTHGHGCDAGYFFDTHQVVKPEDRLQIRLEEGVPPDLVLEPPKLDEAAWPIDRQARAWRNFSGAYVGGRLYWLIDALGEAEAVAIYERALRLTLFQFRERLLTVFGANDAAPVARVAGLWAGWHAAWGDEITLDGAGDGGMAGVVRRSRLHEVGEFSPPATPFPACLEQAEARAWSALAAYDRPGVVTEASGSMGHGPWRFIFRQA